MITNGRNGSEMSVVVVVTAFPAEVIAAFEAGDRPGSRRTGR